MKKTFADLAPTTEQLKRINELAGGELETTDVAVIPVLVIDNTPTIYNTIPDQTWFDQALKDINGKEGVSMQLNHEIGELPSGRLFHAELDVHEGLTVLSALLYTRDNAFVDKYLSGEVKAVSAGLSVSWYKCSICGNEWRSEECFAYSEDKGQKPHWPGMKYDGKTCNLYYMVDEGDKALREVSPVYCGASKGILLTDEQAGEYIKQLSAEVGDSLKNGSPKKEERLSLDKTAEKYVAKALTLAFPQPATENPQPAAAATENGGSLSPATADNGSPSPATTDNGGSLSPATAENGSPSPATNSSEDFSAQIKRLKADNEKLLAKQMENSTAKIAELNSKIATLENDKNTLDGLLSVAEKSLTDVRGKIIDTLRGVVEEPEKLSNDDAIAKLSDHLVLGLDLRVFLANQIGKMSVQLLGNDAPEINVFAAEMSAEKISAEFCRLNDELAEKMQIKGVLKRKNENEIPKRPARRQNPKLYEM